MFKIAIKSPLSGKTNTMEINCTADQIRRYNEGQEHVQDIFPELSLEEREFLISGITPEEWDEIFGEEEE